MRQITAFQLMRQEEHGHAAPGFATLLAAIAAVSLGIGAAAGSEVVAIAGGGVLGIATFAGSFIRHTVIDYDIFRRLEHLEKK